MLQIKTILHRTDPALIRPNINVNKIFPRRSFKNEILSFYTLKKKTSHKKIFFRLFGPCFAPEGSGSSKSFGSM